MYSQISHSKDIERIVNIAEGERYFFGNGSHLEHHEGYSRRVGLYWKSLGYNVDGRNRNWPWSAAFVSYVMKMAGVPFRGSIRHSDYIHAADELDSNIICYSAFNLDEVAIRVGDIVCYNRESYKIHLSDMPDNFKSHGDIVTNIGDGFAEVIGGNVDHSVKTKILKLDQDDFLIDETKEWFAILKHHDNLRLKI